MVLPPGPVSVPVVDLTAPGRSTGEVTRLADEEAGTPFDLVVGRVLGLACCAWPTSGTGC